MYSVEDMGLPLRTRPPTEKSTIETQKGSCSFITHSTGLRTSMNYEWYVLETGAAYGRTGTGARSRGSTQREALRTRPTGHARI